MTSAARIHATRRRLPRLLGVLVAACLALTGLTVQAAQAADTGSITGKIFTKAVGGQPAPATNPYLYVYYSATSGGDYESLDSDPSTEGTDAFRFPGSAFALTGLKSGFYKFEVAGVDAEGYQREFYNNTDYLSEATPISVGTGATAVSDIVLEPAGQISGRVTDTNGKPLAGATVSFLRTENGNADGVSTDANGYYSSTTIFGEGLVRGDYRLAAQHNPPPGNPDAPSHLQEYWKDAISYGSATPVSVTPGVTTGSINFTLDVAPRVTLTVTGPTGQPLANHPVGIYVKGPNGYGPIQSGPWETDASGVLRKQARVGDGYKFVVAPPTGMTGAVTEWYDNAYSESAATPVEIKTAGQQVAIKLQLGPAPAVTGSTPTIAGTPQVGQTLTATPGAWGPTGVQLTYQWLADDAPIAGATAKIFAPTTSQAGKKIAVKVTGTLANHTAASKTSAATTAVTLPPVTASTPTISGTAQVGQTLTAAPGTWGPSGVQLTYQWFADGTPIAAATSTTFVPTEAQAGRKLSVKVTGTLANHTTTAKTSEATAPVAARSIVPGTPTIAGVAIAGKTLSAKPGTWTPDGVQWTYQWLANGVAISTATGSTFKLTNTQAGKRITVQVTGTLAGSTPVSKESASTATVTGILTSKPVSIAGTRKVGRKLRADTPAWGPAPVKLSYRWYRNGRTVSGQDGRYYRLRNADKGKRISVRVHQRKTSYTTVSRLSPRTGAIKKR